MRITGWNRCLVACRATLCCAALCAAASALSARPAHAGEPLPEFKICDQPQTSSFPNSQPPDVAFYLAQNEPAPNVLPSSGQNPTGNENTPGGDGYDGDGTSARLIDRVVDPISWLQQYRVRENWNWPLGNSAGNTNILEFRPTIPFKVWDQENLLRVTVPYRLEDPAGAGLDRVTMFDALVFDTGNLRWGFGPDFRLMPNSGTGDDTFQAGPVFGAIARTTHWSMGFIVQNFLSATDSETFIQPLLAYKFNDQWALTMGDMQIKYNWHDRLWTQLPLGFELDYIANLWGQKVQFFANPQYNFVDNSDTSGWTVFIGAVILVPAKI